MKTQSPIKLNDYVNFRKLKRDIQALTGRCSLDQQELLLKRLLELQSSHLVPKRGSLYRYQTPSINGAAPDYPGINIKNKAFCNNNLALWKALFPNQNYIYRLTLEQYVDWLRSDEVEMPPPLNEPPSRLTHVHEAFALPDINVARPPYTDTLLALDDAVRRQAPHAGIGLVYGAPGVGRRSLLVGVYERIAEAWEKAEHRWYRKIMMWQFRPQAATGRRLAATDEFVHALGDWLDVPAIPNTRLRYKEVLTRLQEEPYLLLLDSLEAVLAPVPSRTLPGAGPTPSAGHPQSSLERVAGNDPSLQMLLEGLARCNPGLCLISSDAPLDLGEELNSRILQFLLPPFSLAEEQQFAHAYRQKLSAWTSRSEQKLGTAQGELKSPLATGSSGSQDSRCRAAEPATDPGLVAGDQLNLEILLRHSQRHIEELKRKLREAGQSDAPSLSQILDVVIGDHEPPFQLQRAIMELISIHEFPPSPEDLVCLLATTELLPKSAMPITREQVDEALASLRSRALMYPASPSSDGCTSHPAILGYFVDSLAAHGVKHLQAIHAAIFTHHRGQLKSSPWGREEPGADPRRVFRRLHILNHGIMAGRYFEALCLANPWLGRGRAMVMACELGCLDAFLETLSLCFDHEPPDWKTLKSDVPPDSHGLIHLLVGLIYFTQGHLRMALPPFERARDAFELCGDLRSAYFTANFIGECLSLLEDEPGLTAVTQWADAHTIVSTSESDPFLVSSSRAYLHALRFLLRQDHVKAQEAFEEAQQQLRVWQQQAPESFNRWESREPTFFCMLNYRYSELLCELSVPETLEEVTQRSREFAARQGLPTYLLDIMEAPRIQHDLECMAYRPQSRRRDLGGTIQDLNEREGRVRDVNLTLPLVRMRFPLIDALLLRRSSSDLELAEKLLTETETICKTERIRPYIRRCVELRRGLRICKGPEEPPEHVNTPSIGHAFRPLGESNH